ncbi:hypothetical protein A9K55_008579 [Cordyceps militaris]|uniref:Uncharacterized protein n=1 Tax=Cordyceps militaris TaxID=73501 RepID=A0A2H4SEP5_CORMI|nr:hypothetical protein A9K55_008579 [Cordyceps militaris]
MSPKNNLRRNGTRMALRQTRMRSRLSGAAPLMSGLDDKGRPRERLPKDPETLTFDQVIQRLRRTKMNLRRRPPVAPKERSSRRGGILRSATRAQRVARWRGYNSRCSAENVFASLYRSTMASEGWGSVEGNTGRRRLPRDILLSMLPRLHTDF